MPQVRDRATLYLYQLTRAPEGPESLDPHWRIPAKGLEAALAAYLEQPDPEQPFDLVGGRGAWGSVCTGAASHVLQQGAAGGVGVFRSPVAFVAFINALSLAPSVLCTTPAGQRAGGGGCLPRQAEGQAAGPGGGGGGGPQRGGSAGDARGRVCRHAQGGAAAGGAGAGVQDVQAAAGAHWRGLPALPACVAMRRPPLLSPSCITPLIHPPLACPRSSPRRIPCLPHLHGLFWSVALNPPSSHTLLRRPPPPLASPRCSSPRRRPSTRWRACGTCWRATWCCSSTAQTPCGSRCWRRSASRWTWPTR